MSYEGDYRSSDEPETVHVDESRTSAPGEEESHEIVFLPSNDAGAARERSEQRHSTYRNAAARPERRAPSVRNAMVRPERGTATTAGRSNAAAAATARASAPVEQTKTDYVLTFGVTGTYAAGFLGGGAGTGFAVGVLDDFSDVFVGTYQSVTLAQVDLSEIIPTVRGSAPTSGSAAFEASFTRGSFEDDFLGTSVVVSATAKGYTFGVTPGSRLGTGTFSVARGTPTKPNVSVSIVRTTASRFRLSEIAPVLERGVEALTSHALGPFVPLPLLMRP